MNKLNLTLDEALEFVSVHPPGQWWNENSATLGHWYAVSSDEAGGIIAYFGEESEAFRFRLAHINRLLNG